MELGTRSTRTAVTAGAVRRPAPPAQVWRAGATRRSVWGRLAAAASDAGGRDILASLGLPAPRRPSRPVERPAAPARPHLALVPAPRLAAPQPATAATTLPRQRRAALTLVR